MPLENGRADERVSRGQASERAVCVCEAVSVEKGARRPPLPTAVVCPPGRRRRRRLAITAVCCKILIGTMRVDSYPSFYTQPFPGEPRKHFENSVRSPTLIAYFHLLYSDPHKFLTRCFGAFVCLSV
jgi:hypothetical protein